ncbi:unnamed protein product [Arabidopsis halleri]
MNPQSMAEEESASPLTEKIKVKEEDKEDDGDYDSDDIDEEDKEDDGDDDSDDVEEEDTKDDGDYDSDDGYTVFRGMRFKYVPEKEPEWDGFIPDYANGIYPFGDLEAPAGENRTNRDELTHLASLCFKKLNEYKGKCVELVSIERATVSGGARWKIYITCMAREYENGPLVEYQAKVMRYAGNYEPPFPILCRPSPKPSI